MSQINPRDVFRKVVCVSCRECGAVKGMLCDSPGVWVHLTRILDAEREEARTNNKPHNETHSMKGTIMTKNVTDTPAPKKRFNLNLPSKTTLGAGALALVGVGLVVVARQGKKSSALDEESPETSEA